MIDKSQAILSLVPDAEFVIREDVIDWHNPAVAPVTEAEIQAEITRLQAEYAANEYQRLRAAEYPDFREYLDGVVKGDQTQIDAYIAACQAVKAKYPKGTE
jgi:tRNA A37 N6-isopentenylltransferase MiaA